MSDAPTIEQMRAIHARMAPYRPEWAPFDQLIKAQIMVKLFELMHRRPEALQSWIEANSHCRVESRAALDVISDMDRDLFAPINRPAPKPSGSGRRASLAAGFVDLKKRASGDNDDA